MNDLIGKDCGICGMKFEAGDVVAFQNVPAFEGSEAYVRNVHMNHLDLPEDQVQASVDSGHAVRL